MLDLRCRIELFGELRLIQEERILTRFRTRKASALLAYLALNLKQTHAREQLLELFWPEMPPETARANLRTTLNSLRNQLEPPGAATGSILIADRRNVSLNGDAVSTDVAEFDRLLALAAHMADPAKRIALLNQATALYRADLLPDLYDDWALQEQDRCRGLYRDALRNLSAALEQSGAIERALDTTRRLMHTAPEDEEGCRMQMRLCLALGRPAAAWESYQTLERNLRTEFDVAPERATREMAEFLRHALEDITDSPPRAPRPRPQRRHAEPVRPTSPTVPAPTVPTSLSSPSLPQTWTRFVGRESRRAALIAKLVDPQTRLVTLLGPGGIGKTRLAVEVGRSLTDHFAGRLWFVSLADFADRRLIPAALVNVLKLPPAPDRDPMDRIVEALGQAECLLILDNFEHLLADTPLVGKYDLPSSGSGAGLVRLLLERIPGLRCLVTSRQVLRLEGEQEFPLAPLALPDSTATTPEQLMQNESVALFTDRAQAAKPDFVLTAQNLPAVTRICRKLDGIPLAIELLAAWAGLLAPAKMLERLEHQLDLLVDRRLYRPTRHQSLRATFEWSYERLEPSARALFARLSVFRGGWTLEAAEEICRPARTEEKTPDRQIKNVLEILGGLQEKSLLQMTETEDGIRFRFLEPLREFAAEKLEEGGESTETVWAHLRYFLRVAEEAPPPQFGVASNPCLDRIDADYDNFRCALEGCLKLGADGGLGLRLVIALIPYWRAQNYLSEGRRWMAKFLSRTEERGRIRERALVLHQAGLFALSQGDEEAGRSLCEESFALYEELGGTHEMMSVLAELAGSAIGRGDYLTAKSLYERALEYERSTGVTQGLPVLLTNLGTVYFLLNDLTRARTLHQEALDISREQNSRREMSVVSLNIGIVATEQGDFARAQSALEESLKLFGESKEIGHLTSILERFGCLANAQNDSKRAFTLWGAAAAIRAEVGLAVPFDERPSLESHLATAYTRTDKEVSSTHWSEGQSLNRDQAIAYALLRIEGDS